MDTVFIDYYTYNQMGSKTASGKARQDCGRILSECGYRGIFMFISRKSPFKTFFSWGKMLIRVPRYANVIVQYPLGGNNSLITKSVLHTCIVKKCKITLLVHDIHSLRYTGNLSKTEASILGMANNIIVHNEVMKEVLSKDVPNVKYYCLQAFDYFINEPAQNHDFDNTVVYAGNLQKSQFLKFLKNLDIRFHLYGAQVDELDQICSDLVRHIGVFNQDDLSILAGDWGLVWDGTSIETCDGNYGEYLKYNAPHKLSLYLVAHLPIIIWEQAAEAKFIVENKLGIAVSALKEIKKATAAISREEYNQMKQNVVEYAKKLVQGENLKALLAKL